MSIIKKSVYLLLLSSIMLLLVSGCGASQDKIMVYMNEEYGITVDNNKSGSEEPP